ncbi:MAG: hypothetical protein U1D97_07415 [Desulfuromonadales bacterium]|nr:hypothetical protein [Desulfuromonadales bacterium]
MNRFRMMLILLTLCFATISMAASPPTVRYDGRSDLLTVQARQVSLLQLLAEISLQTGVEILMDPAAEKTVTVDFEKKTLEDGLRQMTRLHNLNTALSYADPIAGSQRKTPLVIGVKVLPQGKSSSSNLLPVLTGRKEIAARTADAAGKEKIRTLQQQRWEERKAQLSAQERQEIEVKEKQLQAEKAKDKARQDKAKEERDKKKAAREERRKQREEAQKQNDPEGYQRRVEEREKNRQYYIDEFKRQQSTQPAGE